MNDAHLHVMLNHLPMIGSFFAFLTLLIGLITSKRSIIILGLCFYIFLGIANLVVHNTGEGAEHFVEERVQVDHHMVHEHEEQGEYLMFSGLAIGAIAIISLIFILKMKKKSRVLNILILVFSIIQFYLIYQVGISGGKIIHKEIYEEQVLPTNQHHED